MAESQPTAHSPQQHAQLHGSDNLTDRGDLLQRNAETPSWQVGGEPASLTQTPYCLTVHGLSILQRADGGRRSQACIDLSGLFLLAGLSVHRSNVPSPDHQRKARRARRVAANAKLSRPLGFGTGASPSSTSVHHRRSSFHTAAATTAHPRSHPQFLLSPAVPLPLPLPLPAPVGGVVIPQLPRVGCNPWWRDHLSFLPYSSALSLLSVSLSPSSLGRQPSPSCVFRSQFL